jgi:hypothetical protein
MTPAQDPNPPRRLRLSGSLSIAASVATVLLAGLAITVLANAEIRVRSAVEQQRALDAAVQQSASCAGAVASQAAAWKSYVLCELWNDERGSNRAKSALATATSDLTERLPSLGAMAAQAQLPTDGSARAAAGADELSEQLVEAIADTRGADDTALQAADRAVQLRLDQTRHDFSALFRDWSEIARNRRLDATTDAAETAGRMKAWIEILSVAAVVLVTAVGILAVGKETLRVRK